MFSLLLSILVKVCSIKVVPTSVPLWTEEELESFVSLWLVILSAWIKTAMFLLYHSEGCNICEMVLHECYVNDLHTTTCSGMPGHHRHPGRSHRDPSIPSAYNPNHDPTGKHHRDPILQWSVHNYKISWSVKINSLGKSSIVHPKQNAYSAEF
jgi:hypothetical protein